MWQIVCIAFFILALVSVCKFVRVVKRKQLANEPPIVPGHPIFGNGAQFRENAVEFLLDSAKKHGSIFSIRLLHHHVTIVMDPHAYQQFTEEPNFDFDVIQRQVNKNIFQFEVANVKHLIHDASKKVRGGALYATMSVFGQHATDAMEAHMAKVQLAPDDGHWRQDGLKVMLMDTMFDSMLNTLFGKQSDGSTFTARNMGRNLEVFHDYFNFLWIGLPIQMFPEANRVYNEMLDSMPNSQQLLANPNLSPYVREATEIMLRSGQSERSIKCHHAVFTHVNHNTFRAIFWAIYHVLVNPDARAALQDELDCFLQAKTIQDKAEVTTRELNALPILDSVVKETFRHASGVFIIREVVQDTLLRLSKDSDRQYLIRKGDKIAFYPPAIHHDPEIFQEPYKFVYDRFVDRTFYKHGKPIRNPLQPFGSLCPGMQFAQLQIKWFLLVWFANVEAELPPHERTEYNMKNYGNEVVPEVHDVTIRYKRKRTAQLSLV